MEKALGDIHTEVMGQDACPGNPHHIGPKASGYGWPRQHAPLPPDSSAGKRQKYAQAKQGQNESQAVAGLDHLELAEPHVDDIALAVGQKTQRIEDIDRHGRGDELQRESEIAVNESGQGQHEVEQQQRESESRGSPRSHKSTTRRR